jgi:hypothetical protein
MRSPYSVLVAVAWFGLITLPRVAVAEDPSVDELITLAPTVSSAGGKYRDIYLTGRAKLEGFLEVGFRAQYHAPDRYSLCITMPHDNTPFIYQINKELVIYDPVDGAMIYLSNACFNYKLHVVNGKFRFSFGVWKSDDPCAILVDVRSFYDHKATKSEVVRVDSRSLRFTLSPGA